LTGAARQLLIDQPSRYNPKSVTVIGAEGRHWNIAPGFLRKADQAAASKTPNIIALPKR
jgi:hypothetical protein